MERGTTASTRVSEYVTHLTSGLSRRSTLLIVGLLAAGFLWVIRVAPAPVAFGLTAGLAAAWCVWLERHPQAPKRPPWKGAEQAIARGVTAGVVSIKQLGTNGGGYFGPNSAHPFENPTPLSNFVETWSITIIPLS